jgi:hypothetical protein
MQIHGWHQYFQRWPLNGQWLVCQRKQSYRRISYPAGYFLRDSTIFYGLQAMGSHWSDLVAVSFIVLQDMIEANLRNITMDWWKSGAAYRPNGSRPKKANRCFGRAKVAILLSKVAVSVTLDINPSILCRDHVVPGVWWKLIGQTLIKLDQKTEELAPNSKICMKTRGAEWKRQCYSV